jgi:hypothetical protein
MKRKGILCGVGGTLSVALFLVVAATQSRPVEAMDPDGPRQLAMAQVSDPASPKEVAQAPASSPVPTDGTAPFSGYAATPQPTPTTANPTASVAPPPSPIQSSWAMPDKNSSSTTASAETPAAPAHRDHMKLESIDELLHRLKTIKTQKAELERTEQELVVMLREKLKEQKQQIQTLGIPVEEIIQTGYGMPPQSARPAGSYAMPR